jgi:hypothetical protein
MPFGNQTSSQSISQLKVLEHLLYAHVWNIGNLVVYAGQEA